MNFLIFFFLFFNWFQIYHGTDCANCPKMWLDFHFLKHCSCTTIHCAPYPNPFVAYILYRFWIYGNLIGLDTFSLFRFLCTAKYYNSALGFEDDDMKNLLPLKRKQIKWIYSIVSITTTTTTNESNSEKKEYWVERRKQ